MATDDLRWHWEEVDPARTNASGDLSKMFKNEPVKVPGVFSVDAPSPAAALLVREVIQNSWDAALERRDAEQTSEPFEVRFKFRHESNSRRREIAERLGLWELSYRAATVANRRSLGLDDTDCLVDLDEDDDLTLLEISERAGGGMYGPWVGDKSKLWLALCSIGMTSEVAGRGGSYGYGKAGLIRGSAIRTVVAYTCFEERPEELGVTRRLLGMTYWDSHAFDGTSWTGSARFGQLRQGTGVEPYENDEADVVAEHLGLRVRDPSVESDLGSSFLLVEPTVEVGDVVSAIERYWWPALYEQSLHFEAVVEDAEGDEHHPRPQSSETIRPFITAYEVATTPQDNRRGSVRRRAFRRHGEFDSPGVLGLIADQAGWSHPEYSEGESGVEHRSLVALVRTPRMVVEYLDAGASAPFVRGVFVADESVNEPLRLTEPKAHDAWQTVASSDVPARYADLAKALTRRIKQAVASFRGHLTPIPKPAENLRMPEFDRIMRLLMRGGGGGDPPPPKPDERPFSIRPGGRLSAKEDGSLCLEGTARIEFSPHYEVDPDIGGEIEVSVSYRFVEEDHPRGSVEMAIQAPSGFKPVQGRTDTYRGQLFPGTPAHFEYLSEDYDPTWTGKLFVTATLVSDDGATEQVAQ